MTILSSEKHRQEINIKIMVILLIFIQINISLIEVFISCS
jgi:hypothetical protein